MSMFAQLVREAPPPKVAKPRPRRDKPVRTFGGKYTPRMTPWGLTPVQCEIARLMAEEWLTCAEVADRLDLSPKTVSTHCARMRERMDARSLLHAIVLWDRHFRPVFLTPAEPGLQPV